MAENFSIPELGLEAGFAKTKEGVIMALYNDTSRTIQIGVSLFRKIHDSSYKSANTIIVTLEKMCSADIEPERRRFMEGDSIRIEGDKAICYLVISVITDEKVFIKKLTFSKPSFDLFSIEEGSVAFYFIQKEGKPLQSNPRRC